MLTHTLEKMDGKESVPDKETSLYNKEEDVVLPEGDTYSMQSDIVEHSQAVVERDATTKPPDQLDALLHE